MGEPRVVNKVKREAVGRSGLLTRTESDAEEDHSIRVSLRRLARVANWHHLPRVAAKPRSLSATSSSSCSSLLSASRKPRAQQRTSSVARLLPSPSIRSFSPSSHLPQVATKPQILSATSSSSCSSLLAASRNSRGQQRTSSAARLSPSPSIGSFSPSNPLQCSNTSPTTSYLNHTSNKMSASTSNLLQSPPSSPLSYSPPQLSLSSSSVLQFSSSLSSLEEGHNLAEEKNREVEVYLQVPPTILVSSKRRAVETGRFLSSLLLQKAWAG